MQCRNYASAVLKNLLFHCLSQVRIKKGCGRPVSVKYCHILRRESKNDLFSFGSCSLLQVLEIKRFVVVVVEFNVNLLFLSQENKRKGLKIDKPLLFDT